MYRKKRNFLKLKFTKRYTPLFVNNSFVTTFFYFPSIWSFVFCLQNKTQYVLFLYSQTYYSFFPIPLYASNLILDLQMNSIGIELFYRNAFYGLFCNFFKKVFFQFSQIFFKKIKFKGKGYYAYKNYRNVFALQFGYSHIIRRYFYFINAKFLAKTSIFLFGINQSYIFKAAYRFFFVKPINIFTSRGIRFTRQIVYKKTGKISSYR
jgi:hypothetical protein